MIVKNKPDFLDILQTCTYCGCELYVGKHDIHHSGGELVYKCPYCHSNSKLSTGFNLEREQVCDHIQEFIRTIAKKVNKVKDEDTQNELKGVINLIYEAVEKERN